MFGNCVSRIRLLYCILVRKQQKLVYEEIYVECYRTRQEELKDSYTALLNKTITNSSENEMKYTDSIFVYFVINGSVYKFLRTYVALCILAGFTLSVIFFSFGRSIFFYRLAAKASKNLHEKMFRCLLQAPMKFFNVVPCGRILNRFAKDIGGVDELLPRFLLESLQVCRGLIAKFIIIFLFSNDF